MILRPEYGERACRRHSGRSKHCNPLAEEEDKHHDRVVFEERRQERQPIADDPHLRSAFGE